MLIFVRYLLQAQSLVRGQPVPKVQVRSFLFSSNEGLADSSVGYQSRPQPSSYLSHPFPFAHLRRRVDRHHIDPRRWFPYHLPLP